MRKVLKGNNKKIISLILMGVLLFSAVSLCIIKIINYNKQANPNLNVSAAYIITDATSLQSNYGSYSEFHINSLGGLQAFAESVYTVSERDQSFSGKTVKLMANIDCDGEIIRVGARYINNNIVETDPTFAGIFNGNGKTISNVCLVDSVADMNETAYVNIGGDRQRIDGARGFFMKVTGRVENLRLQSVTTQMGLNGGFNGVCYIHQGALVGVLDGGTIINCAVEGFSGAAISNGIAGSTFSGTITNCYTSGISGALQETTGIGPSSTTVLNGDVQTRDMTCTISGCVTRSSIISALSSTNCHTTANSISGLDLEKVWYHHSSYNDGYPYLRAFMEFSTFSFDTNGDGTYDETREVSSDVAQTTLDQINNQTKQANIYLTYANSVTRGDIPTGKYFVEWSTKEAGGGYNENGSFKMYGYIALFADDQYGLMFCLPTCDGAYIDVTVNINGTDYSLVGNGSDAWQIIDNSVKYGDRITCSVSYSSGKTLITYRIGNTTAVYSIDGIYALDNYGTLGSSGPAITNGSTVPDAGNLYRFIVRPILKLKTYNSIFV